jgi:riboflavin kinase / FMN adenylyltransferase
LLSVTRAAISRHSQPELTEREMAEPLEKRDGTERFLVARLDAPLPAGLERPVIAIGNFDGLHSGHRAVIAAAQALAAKLGRPAAVLTFEPHPRTFFRPAEPVFRLTPQPVQATILARWQLDGMIVGAFDAAMAGTTAEAFIDGLLVERLGVAGVAIGHDFHFGKGRGGSPAVLSERGEKRGIPVVVVSPVTDHAVPVSSSRIRAALEAGRIAEANELLGYRWFIEARVLHGAKRGRVLGFPTANLRLPDDCRLRHGIYAVRMALDGALHDGVASFGRRPTFDNGAALLEVFVFEFDADLYGRDVAVEFCGFVRGEERFDSVDALVAQMHRDSAEARRLLAALPAAPPSLIS